MKKVLILILAVVLSLSMFAMVACQPPCETHVDGNHDGICDVCETTGLSVTHTDSNHDGKCDGCGGDTQFEHVDAAHDGKCDVCNKTVAVNHVDANNDGYCDVEACGHKYAWVDALADAKEYVDGLYLNASVSTTADYTVTTIVSIGGVKYNVAWEIQSAVEGQTAVSLGEVDENKQLTINVDEFSAQEVAYKLVATISDAEGHSVKVEYAREVPEFIVATYEEYLAACAANSTETIISVRGYVTAINADSGSSSKGSIWIRDAEGNGYYAYKPTLDASVTESRESILAAFPVGTEIVISGTVGNKYGPQHNAGCTIIKTGNTAPAGWNTPVDQTEAFANANGMMDAENLQQYYGSMVTIKGVTMGQIDGYNYYFTINGKQYICYMNIYLMDNAASSATAAKWVVGGKANLTGLVTTYSQKFQIYPYGPECVEIVKEELTDAQIVERAKAALSFETNHVLAAGEIELPAEIAGYEVSLAWALDKSYDFAAISEGKLVVSALPAEATTIKLVATISKGSVSDTLEFEVDVDAAQVGAVTEVNLTSETLGLKNAYADGTATVAGVDFQYIELGDYGDGIQSRNKNGKASTLWNTTAFPSDIVSVEITITDGKAGYDNTDVFMLSFGATAEALTEEISHNESKGVLTYTYTPSAGARFFKMIKTNTYSSYYASIKITLAEVKEEGPLAEGQAYTMSVVQGNLGNKTLYFNGTTREADGYPWYFKTSENVADAAHVFVEVVDGGYKLYFMNGETKTYIRLYERSAGSASLALVTEAPAEVYTFDEEYKTLVLTVGNNKYYMGTYNTFDTLSGSNYSYIKTSFPCTFAPVEGGEVPPAHTCESKCETCGKCTDTACTETACAEKCEGHTPAHECANVCPTCGKCTNEDCAESVCAEKCEGHEPVVQEEKYTLAIPADSATWSEETLINDIFYATNKAKTESIKISGASYEADGLTFSGKQISLTGGKVQLKDGAFLNAIKVTVESGKQGHFAMYVASKVYDDGREIRISILDAEGNAVTATNIMKNGVAGEFGLLSTTEVEKYEFDLPAGTYYLGGSSGGAYLYGMTVTLSAAQVEEPAAVVINGQNYSEAQAEEALLALKADDVVTILANATIAKEYTFVAANYTIGEGAVLVAQANMVAPAGAKLTVSANAKLVVEAGVTIDISALTQEDFATSAQARLEIAEGATVIMPAYTEQLWKDAYLKAVIEAMVADSDVGAKLVLGETKLTKTANGWEAEAPAFDGITSIEEALSAKDGVAVQLTGRVTGYYNGYKSNFHIQDENGKSILVYYSTADANLGDIVTVTGTLGSFNGTKQVAKGSTFIVVEAHVCSTYTEATCLEAAKCTICAKANGDALGHTEPNAQGKCDRCGAALASTGKVATFTFGSNSSAAHVDGNDLGASKTYTDGAYSLVLTGMSKVYGPAYDAKGNSALKLGTSKVVGTFKFTVSDDVTKVVIYVAQYKANATKITVNGQSYTISTASNNGAYTAITVDTTTTKTVTFTTVSGGVRCMIDAIEFWAE